MRMILLAHVIAGGLGLLSGYVALSVAKGASLHRKSGMLFVYVMVTMSVTGLLIAAMNGVAPAINIPTALLTFYLVLTGLTTVGPTAGWSRTLSVSAMVMAFGITVGCLALALLAIGKGGAAAGMAYPLVMFGVVAGCGGVGDLRTLRSGPLKGSPRLKRHLWRMGFGLFVASIAFYLGPDRLPHALRHPAFRAAGLLTPIVAMSYWMLKLRSKRDRSPLVRTTETLGYDQLHT